MKIIPNDGVGAPARYHALNALTTLTDDPKSRNIVLNTPNLYNIILEQLSSQFVTMKLRAATLLMSFYIGNYTKECLFLLTAEMVTSLIECSKLTEREIMDNFTDEGEFQGMVFLPINILDSGNLPYALKMFVIPMYYQTCLDVIGYVFMHFAGL